MTITPQGPHRSSQPPLQVVENFFRRTFGESHHDNQPTPNWKEQAQTRRNAKNQRTELLGPAAPGIRSGVYKPDWRSGVVVGDFWTAYQTPNAIIAAPARSGRLQRGAQAWEDIDFYNLTSHDLVGIGTLGEIDSWLDRFRATVVALNMEIDNSDLQYEKDDSPLRDRDYGLHEITAEVGINAYQPTTRGLRRLGGAIDALESFILGIGQVAGAGMVNHFGHGGSRAVELGILKELLDDGVELVDKGLNLYEKYRAYYEPGHRAKKPKPGKKKVPVSFDGRSAQQNLKLQVRLYAGPYIEQFARLKGQPVRNWHTWYGNQLDSGVMEQASGITDTYQYLRFGKMSQKLSPMLADLFRQMRDLQWIS